MSNEMDQESLREEHTEEAIAARLAAATKHSYLGDFVLGAVDGAVTTFAVVCGVAGAGLQTGIAVVLGIANVLADGFSMAVGNYLSTKSEHDLLGQARRTEELHIERHPEGEREEIRQIFRSKGFEGELLESITSTITEERERWVDTMLTDELGLQLEPPRPVRAASVTFIAFMLAGSVPIVPLFFSAYIDADQMFGLSAIATGLVFVAIGFAKGRVTGESIWRAVVETLGIGGFAALLAYLAGGWLKGFIGT